jgi:hypothetical protein
VAKGLCALTQHARAFVWMDARRVGEPSKEPGPWRKRNRSSSQPEDAFE